MNIFFIASRKMSNINVRLIFKESINKLNSMISKLDTQLGVNSFQTQINSLNTNTNATNNNIAPKNEIITNPETDKKKNISKNSKNENTNSLKEEIKKAPKAENKGNNNNKNKEDEEKEAKLKLFSECDLRVGKVIELKYLENSEDIYRLKIDLGEEQPREIGTGLRKYVKEDEILNKNVIVFANLKPKKLGDFYSNGMVLSCCTEDYSLIELLRPAENAQAGENVTIEGLNFKKEITAQINDKKFKKAMPLFKSDDNLNATYNNMILYTASGPVTSKTLKNCPIS